MDRIDAVILTNLEIMCIAALMGMDSIYGYKATVSDRLKYTLYNLAKKQYLEVKTVNGADKVILNTDIAKIFTLINNARSIIELKCVTNNEKILIYCNKDDDTEAAIFRPNVTKNDEVIVSIIKKIDVYEYLETEGYVKSIKNRKSGKSLVYEKVCRDNLCEDKLLFIKMFSKQHDIEATRIREINKIDVYETCMYSEQDESFVIYTEENFRRLVNI